MLRQCKHLTVGEPPSVWPIVGIRLPQYHGELLELIHLRATGEKRLEGIQLGHDAAEREDVDRVVVRAATEDVLGCTVPSRGDILGEGCGMPDLFHQAEIAKLNSCFFLD